HKGDLLVLLRCLDAGVEARRDAFARQLAQTPAPPTSVLEAAALLLAAASRGVQVFLANDRLRVRPANGLTPEERAILRSLRDQGPVISHELCWRVEAMRSHVPPSPVPIHALL